MDKRRFLMILDNIKLPFVLSWVEGESRTRAQNALIHKWFGEIALALEDDPDQIKAECNLEFGRPIMDRDDEEWASAFGYFFGGLNKPAKLKAIRVFDIPFTRRMKVKQLSEYMNQMQQHYAEVGITLTDPEMLGREEMRR